MTSPATCACCRRGSAWCSAAGSRRSRASTSGGGGSTRSATFHATDLLGVGPARAPLDRVANRARGAGARRLRAPRAHRSRAPRRLPPRRHPRRARRAHRAVPRRRPHPSHRGLGGERRVRARAGRAAAAAARAPRPGRGGAGGAGVLRHDDALGAVGAAGDRDGVVALVAGYLGRPTVGLRVLVLAATALLLADPFLLHQVGFLLSCAASLGIALLARPITAWLRGPGVDVRGARGHRRRADRRRARCSSRCSVRCRWWRSRPTWSRCRWPRRSRCGAHRRGDRRPGPAGVARDPAGAGAPDRGLLHALDRGGRRRVPRAVRGRRPVDGGLLARRTAAGRAHPRGRHAPGSGTVPATTPASFGRARGRPWARPSNATSEPGTPAPDPLSGHSVWEAEGTYEHRAIRGQSRPIVAPDR